MTADRGASSRRGSWRRWSIRRQLTVASVVVVLGALLVGIGLLAFLLQRSLTHSLAASVRDEARRLTVIVTGMSPEVIKETDVLGDVVQDGWKAQVIDARGRVVASSKPTLTTPLTLARPEVGQTLIEGSTVLWLPGRDDKRDLVVALGFPLGSTTGVLVVAASQASQHEAVSTTVTILLGALPVFLLLTGAAAWMLVGRSLRPVEQMRERVEQITTDRLDERVPVPDTQDEIGVLARTMNTMLARLQQSRDAQTQFVSDASHELRSPLTTLQAALEIGGTEQSEQTWRELEPLMRTETTRLRTLVADLLLLTRADDRGLTPRLVDIDLDDLVDAEARRLRETGTVQVETTVRAARITGDPGALARALRNLVDNAVRHAHETIRLTVSPLDGGGARLTVEDDGAGIPPADRARVFERFVRLDESRSRDSGGSGLGLPITREIVGVHGGTVEVGESDLGGASFVVVLPTHPPSAASR